MSNQVDYFKDIIIIIIILFVLLSYSLLKGDAKNLKLLIRILDSMSEDQLEHPEKIKSPQREKIAIRAETVI